MKRLIFLLALLLASPAIHADNAVLSAGFNPPSLNPHTMLGEYQNKSAQYSLRYEGEHYGARIDHSVGGDDDGNTYLTGDALFRPAKWFVAGAGIMVDQKPLRTVGSRMNFHAVLGLEAPDLFGHAGLGLYFDHWSNGHIHALFGPDNVLNPPRNVLSLGLILH